MTPMIEAVARALCFARGLDPDDVSPEPNEPKIWECHVHHAEAAIRAMREPTERMLYFADGYTDLSGYHSSCDAQWRKEEFKIAWQVMVDEALGEFDG